MCSLRDPNGTVPVYVFTFPILLLCKYIWEYIDNNFRNKTRRGILFCHGRLYEDNTSARSIMPTL